MRRDEIDRIIDGAGAAQVVEKLAEFVTPARRERMEEVLAARLFGLHVAVEDPYDPHNAAAVVRSAEAFGAACVHVIGAAEAFLRSKRTTAGTHHWVETRKHPDLDDFFTDVRGRGMVVAAACVDATTTLEELPVDRPICLLLGNEHRGLSEAARGRADSSYVIPTFGFAESLNLSVSAAVSLYAVASRRRAHLRKKSDLLPLEAARERARWYLRSVDERLVRGLFGAGADGAPEA